MELLHSRVRSHSGLDDLLLLEHGQTLLDVAHLLQVMLPISSLVCFQFDSVHTSKEYLEDGLHIVDEHFLEVLLLPVHVRVRLFLPHLEDYALIDAPVAHVAFELLNMVS